MEEFPDPLEIIGHLKENRLENKCMNTDVSTRILYNSIERNTCIYKKWNSYTKAGKYFSTVYTCIK